MCVCVQILFHQFDSDLDDVMFGLWLQLGGDKSYLVSQYSRYTVRGQVLPRVTVQSLHGGGQVLPRITVQSLHGEGTSPTSCHSTVATRRATSPTSCHSTVATR